jgi:hypothetical protein
MNRMHAPEVHRALTAETWSAGRLAEDEAMLFVARQTRPG